jgi:hypothetical protein
MLGVEKEMKKAIEEKKKIEKIIMATTKNLN